MGAETTCPLDLADSLEAEAIPDLTGRNVSLVDEVEDRICVALVEIVLVIDYPTASRLKIKLQVLERIQDTHHPYVFHSPFRERRELLGIPHYIHGSFGLIKLVSISRLSCTVLVSTPQQNLLPG